MPKYNPVCEICHGRPKMDRCSCCEECWYSGRYARVVEEDRIWRHGTQWEREMLMRERREHYA